MVKKVNGDRDPKQLSKWIGVPFWTCWSPVFLFKSAEHVVSGHPFSYLLTLLTLNWARVLSGLALGALECAILWTVNAAADPSLVCASYVCLLSYVVGNFVIGYFNFMHFLAAFDPRESNIPIVRRIADVSPVKSLDFAAYGGRFVALGFGGINLAKAANHYPYGTPIPDDWCSPGGQVPASWMGVTFFVIGALSGAVKMPQFRADPKFICQEWEIDYKDESHTVQSELESHSRKQGIEQQNLLANAHGLTSAQAALHGGDMDCDGTQNQFA